MTIFTHYTLENAPADAKELLETVQNGYGFIPDLFAYMAEAPLTIQAYLDLNNTLRQTSFSEQQLQLALLATSVKNACTFCTVAHTALAKKAKANTQAIDAIVKGTEIENKEDAILVKTIQAIVETRGWISDVDLNTFFAAGFTKKQYMELILVATIKTLSNYINHQTHPEANPELVALANA